MKKLFATLLAATMVAGTAVSALAYEDIIPGVAGTKASTDDYTLGSKALNDKGEIKDSRAKSGEKIYYPILVNGDAFDKSLDASKWYYATAASEVQDLKVTLKAVRGGKYIKGATIVRKDLDGNAVAEEPAVTGNKGTFTIDLSGVTLGSATAGDKVVIKVGTTTLGTITLLGTETNLNTALNGLTVNYNNVEFTCVNTVGSMVFTTASNVDVTVPTLDTPVTVEIVSKDANPATTTIANETGKKVSAPTNGKADKPKVDAKGQLPKMYFVEVALADYFGTDESEIDFDLSLRTRSTQYETKDATKDFPRTSFDIGNDAKTLYPGDGICKKFRNNELTLSIDKNTPSVKLDEAKETKDAPEAKDVEKIFLEGDNFDYEVKASGQDDLYLELNEDANKKVILANQDAKMTFFNFPGKPEFDFTGVAKFTVEDPDINYYFYEIVDDKPVKTSAKYNKEDECFELRTRTLGSYVISDKELEAADTTEKPAEDKPTDKPAEEKPVNPTTPDKNVPTGAIA